MRYPGVVIALIVMLSACGGGDDASDDTVPGEMAPGNAVAGALVYQDTCIVCHGADMQGLEGLGKPLAPSEFVQQNSEDELVAFLLVGRPASDPLNTQGIDMPPRGGNPALTDQDLHDIAAYLLAQQ